MRRGPGEFPDIRLVEHESADVALSEVEVAVLLREFRSRLGLIPTTAEGIFTLQAHQHVGFVVLPTQRVIEIQPKVRIGVLFAMLAKAHQLANFLPREQAYTSVADLFEFLVAIFTDMIENLVAAGILRGFEANEDDLLALRGKLLLTETIRQRPVVRDRHRCSFTEFTADVSENRIIKLTCNMLLSFHYRIVQGLSLRLRRLNRAFTEVMLDPYAAEFFERLVYHRLNEHYQPALALARMLLSYLSPSGVRGTQPFLAFLVDMNSLFERYLTTALQEMAAARSDITVAYTRQHTLDLDNQIKVIPDAVIYREDMPSLALDAKYKRDDPQTDVYQALSYCHALRIRRTILAYPASEGIPAMRHRIRPDGSLEIILIPVDLSGDLADLELQTRAFAESVWLEVS